MHVTYIHQHFCTPKGSFGTRSYEFAQRLIAAGHSVSMICGVGDRTADAFGGPFTGVKQLDSDGIDVRCIAAKYSNSMGFYGRLRSFGEFAQQATKVAKTIDTDLVFATSTPLSVGIPGMKAAKHHKVPFVFEVRDLWPELPIKLGMLKNPILKAYARHLEKKIYFSSKHIIGLSPGMKEGISETGYPGSQITMIPNGCDLNLFRPSTARLQNDRFGESSQTRFIFAGAHGRANGLDAVLDAAKVLQQRGFQDARFVFIGGGSERDRLIQRSKDEGTESIISWIHAIPKQELAEILPQMDVGMQILKNIDSFYYGTSPNKFFDYISSGIPVLNNYPGWVADMIGDNECGVAVEPDNPEAFANAVERLCESESARREMGANGRRLAEAKFSRDLLAGQFVEILESVHEGDGRSGPSKSMAVASTHDSNVLKDLIVVGCGGHGKVVIQTARAAGYKPVAVYDDDPALWGTVFFGVPVIGPVKDMPDCDTPVIIALGHNGNRHKIAESLPRRWATIVHPKAIVAPTAEIGEGSMILAGCVVQADAKIGRHVIMNTASTVDHDSIVGDHCHLCPGVHIPGDVRLGEGVMMGVGASAIPGTNIGDWVTVGAGSCVIRDIPNDVVAVGVPAKTLQRGLAVESSEDVRESINSRKLPR